MNKIIKLVLALHPKKLFWHYPKQFLEWYQMFLTPPWERKAIKKYQQKLMEDKKKEDEGREEERRREEGRDSWEVEGGGGSKEGESGSVAAETGSDGAAADQGSEHKEPGK